MASSRPRLFKDLDPVPVAEVHSIVGDDTTAKRKDGPKGSTKRHSKTKAGHAMRNKSNSKAKGPSKAKGLKKVTGPKFRPSDMAWLKLVACFRPMWELALQFDALIEASKPLRAPGAKRKYRTFEAMFLDVIAWRYGTYEWAADNLADPDVWNPLRAAVEQAYPYNRRMRLCETPPSRSQNYRFRQQYATDHLRKVMLNHVERVCVEAILQTGMLPPKTGSLTNPDPYSFMSADGCWLPALTSLTVHDAVDPETGEIVGRYDPDALTYHTHDGKASSPGHLLVMVLARNPYPKERIVASVRLKSAHNPEVNRNDATIAVDAVLELLARFPKLRANLVGLVYDMELSAADFDRLLDAGLIPVSKVSLTSQGRPASQNLGPHDFKTEDGQTVSRTVTAVNGTPCVTVTDGHGIGYYVPLKLIQVKKTDRKNRPQISTRWAIPDKKLVPVHLVGAKTRIRHTRTNKERDAGLSRSRALRIFPESDERFPVIFPRREDSESGNSDKKSRMWNRRCRTLRHQSVEFNAITYQIHVLITALLAYHNRTGADMTRWFGQHQLPRKVRRQAPLALAA